MDTFLIIDGHAIIHRAFHALPPLTSANGTPTNAVYGFFNMIYKAVADFKPSHLVICFDTATPTFRKELLPSYQASRPKPADELIVQFGIIRELLDAAGIARLEAPGFEADDVIGSVAELEKKPGRHIYILSGDKDLLQLVDENVSVIMPKIGLSNIVIYDPKAVRERFDLEPSQIPDLKALAGDASDNYQAVKGIGPKTADRLLKQFGNVEKLITSIDELQDVKLREKLKENLDMLKTIKTIATIRRDIPIPLTFDQMAVRPYPETLKAALEKHQFNSLRKRFFPDAVGTETINEQPKAPKKPTIKKDSSQLDMF